MTRLVKLLLPVVSAFLIAPAAYADGDGDDDGCGGGDPQAPVLGTHLAYRQSAWTIDAAHHGLLVDAPARWSFVTTPQAQGRFHDRTGTQLLSVDIVDQAGGPRVQMHQRDHDLAGTPGLTVQTAQVDPGHQGRWATLTYEWTDMGMARLVMVRWVAYGPPPHRSDVVVTVAGRVEDRAGLRALLHRASRTASVAG